MKTTLKVWAIAAMVLLPMIAWAEPTNMLADGGFEDSKPNAMFGTQWEEWELGARTEAETTDILEGSQAMRFIEASTFGNVQQEVSMLNEPEGEELVLTIHYKVVSSTNSVPLGLHCSWELRTDPDTSHDEDVLIQDLEKGDGWETVQVRTTVPANASKLHVGINYAKNTLLLLDDWTLYRASDITTSVEQVSTTTKSHKAFVNGQMVILRDGKMYNALGAEL